MKQSMLRCELLFGVTTDGASLTMGPCLSAEGSKDTCTDAERAELLAWVRPSSLTLLSHPCTHIFSSHRLTVSSSAKNTAAQHTPFTNRRRLMQLRLPVAIPGTQPPRP